MTFCSSRIRAVTNGERRTPSVARSGPSQGRQVAASGLVSDSAPAAYVTGLIVRRGTFGQTNRGGSSKTTGVVRLSVNEEIFTRHGRYGIDYPEHIDQG
jgi:hypothetical protein